MVTEVTTDNWHDFIDAPLVILDFWADWCGPCKIMSPVVEQLADEFKGQIKFGSVDVDKYQNIAQEYKVLGMPTLVLCRNGKGVEKVTGVYPKPALSKFLKSKLAEN